MVIHYFQDTGSGLHRRKAQWPGYLLSDSLYRQFREDFNGTAGVWRRATIEEHLRRLCALIDIENQGHLPSWITAEQIGCRQFRRHVVKYLTGMQGLGDLRQNLSKMDAIPDIMAAVDRIL